MSSRVLVLGGSGMLGTAVLGEFLERGIPTTATTRDLSLLPADIAPSFVAFDVGSASLAELLGDLGAGDFVVNCIGIIKHHMDDSNAASRRSAIETNALFPYALDSLAREQGFHVIQIATDCVYTGDRGRYDEEALHDATDVYGKSKSLGEVPSTHMVNLRCSIIGRELKNKKSLLEWVLAHEPDSSFTGYTDHFWNGVTVQAFARVAAGIVQTGNPVAGTVHLVPEDILSKHALSRLILTAYGRDDVTVVPTPTGGGVDRTLATLHPETNARLWLDAGYAHPPTIETMIQDLALPSATYVHGETQ